MQSVKTINSNLSLVMYSFIQKNQTINSIKFYKNGQHLKPEDENLKPWYSTVDLQRSASWTELTELPAGTTQ